MLNEMGLTGTEGLAIAQLHEEARSLLEAGRYQEARQVAEQVLKRRPDFVPALNNISQTYFIEGRLSQATLYARRVLEVDPNNAHALANLTRFYYLSGDQEQALQGLRHHLELLGRGDDRAAARRRRRRAQGRETGEPPEGEPGGPAVGSRHCPASLGTAGRGRKIAGTGGGSRHR